MSKNRGISLLKLAVSIFFLIGFMSFLKPCGPKEDGTWMHCHQAGQALCLIAAGLALLSLAALLMKGKASMLLALLSIILALLAIILPGHVISLCMMPEMRCRAITAPAGFVFGILMIVFSIAGLFLRRKEKV